MSSKYYVKDSEEHKQALEKQEQIRKEKEVQKTQKKNNNNNNKNNNNNNNNKDQKNGGGDRKNNYQGNRNNNRQRRERNDSQDSQDGYRRRHRKSKYNFNSREVTLETEVPEIPKNIKKPDRKAFLKKLDDLEDRIDKLFQEKDDKIYELQENIKSTSKETSDEQQPIREQLNTLKGERRQLFQNWQEKKKEFKVVEQELVEIELKKNAILGKMNFKEGITFNQLQRQIDELNQKIYNNLHGKTEEILLIKRKERLEAALPLAEPLQEVEDEIYDVEQELRRKKKQMNYHYALYKEKEKVEQATFKEFESKKEFIKENKSGLKPQIEAIKQEFKAKIDKVKDERGEVKKKYTKQVEDYEDYLDLQDYVDFLNRIQDIIRGKEKKREEREKKQKEYEEKKKKWEQQKKAKEERERKYQERIQKEKDEEKQRRKELRALQIPFAEELQVLKQLITYCHEVAGTENVNEDGTVQQQQAELDEKSLKKEKLTLIKRKDNDEFLEQKPKGKKKNQKPKQQEVSQQLVPDFGTINQFQQIGVSPPRTVENVEAALKLLIEKRDYFQKQQDEELQKRKEREEKGEESEEEENDVQEQQDKEEVQEEEKQQKPKKQQYKFTTEEFPSMQ